MGLEVTIKGAATIHEVAARMRAEGRKDLSREMGKALSKAVEPVKRDVRAEAAEVMPREGGYNAAFDKSLTFRVNQRGAGETARLNLTTYAEGESERRDIRSLNAGKLRHPVHGRSRPGRRKGERHANPWAVTSIRAGFWNRGVDGALDEAQKAMQDVVDDYARRLAG